MAVPEPVVFGRPVLALDVLEDRLARFIYSRYHKQRWVDNMKGLLDLDSVAMNIGQPVSHGGWWNVYWGIVAAILVAAVVAYALTVHPPAKLEVVEPVSRPDEFQKRYGDHVPSLLSGQVRTIPIVRTADIEPRFDIRGVLQAVPIPPPPPAPVAQAVVPARQSPDICTRHKLRKVVTKGGRSWRCRK